MTLLYIQQLLEQVIALNERYKKINELTGENFNVFRVLKLESSEVRMHSAFIGELLDPKGSHDQKDVFIKIFIEKFCFKNNSIDSESCKIEIEKHAGIIDNNNTTGGRIDIFIEDKNKKHIIIENKIYAGDQKNQLVRYCNHSPNADIFYLTLDGKEPDPSSKGKIVIEKDFICLSYKDHIIEWLEDCRKEVATLPIIRETITQYINLIKFLTNQTQNDTMKEELSTIIISNLEAAFIISDNLDNSLIKLESKLDEELKDVALQLGLVFENRLDFKKKHTGFFFRRKDWQHSWIGFEFQNYDRDFLYGIKSVDENNYPKDVRNKILEISKFRNSNWWPMYKYLENPYRNWKKYEVWKAIQGVEMKNIIQSKIIEVLDITKRINGL